MFKQLVKVVIDNKESIATGVAIAGVVFTGIASAKAGIKANDILGNLDREKDGEVTTKEKVKAIAPTALPPFLIVAITIGLITFTYKTNLKAQAGLISALAVSEGANKETIEKIVEKVGPEKIKEAKREAAIDKLKTSDSDIYDLGGDTLFYDPFLDRKFLSTENAIRAAAGQIATEMLGLQSQTINDLYSYIAEYGNGHHKYKDLGVGEVFGWNCGFDDGPGVNLYDADTIDGKAYRIFDYSKALLADAIL